MSGSRGRGRRQKHVEPEEHENHERWLVTYADMLTLLMVLFIVMFAISQVDKKKFTEFSNGLSASFGGQLHVVAGGPQMVDDDSAGPALPDLTAQVKARPADSTGVSKATDKAKEAQKQAEAAAQRELDDMAKARKAMQAALHAKKLDNAVRFSIDERGMVVRIITDKVLFPSDRADLQPFGVTLLDALGPPLRKLPNALAIEGHTNTAPVKPKYYPSEWELSSARAVTVLRYLVDHEKVSARRVS